MDHISKAVQSNCDSILKQTEYFIEVEGNALTNSIDGKNIFFGCDGDEATYLAMWYISQSKKVKKDVHPEVSTSYVSFSTIKTSIDKEDTKVLEETTNGSQDTSEFTKLTCMSKTWTIDEVMEQWRLLISQLRREAIPVELPISKAYQEPNYNLFTVYLKSITLSQKLIESNEQQEAFTNHYVCIATSGKKVLSTKMLKDTDIAHINTEMIFDNLLSNFTITLSVYSLGSKNQQVVSQKKESKWCKMKNLFKQEKEFAVDFNAKSQFILVGKCVLDKKMLISNQRNLKLADLSVDTVLDGRITLLYDIYL